MKPYIASALALLCIVTSAVHAGVPCPPEVVCTDGDCPEVPACPAAAAGTLEGFGTGSSFGEGPQHEICSVTNLENDGPGSLRSCIEDRNGPLSSPTPRKIVFSVAGTITLTSDLRIRQPYLTLDGLSAPSPGITLLKLGSGEDGETHIDSSSGTCGHDVLVQGIRFIGTWGRTSPDHSQNAGLMSIDGEDLVGCMNNVVLHRNTYMDGQDAVGQFWGSVKDATFSHNFLLYNYHPQTVSHWPGGVSGQERQRLSIHHNVYAYFHDRAPNIRGNVWDSNVTQNVFHRWAAFGFGGGYATRFRCRGGGCPQRINLTDNYYSSSGSALRFALLFQDSADKSEVFTQNNRFPAEETDRGEAPSRFDNNDGVTILPYQEWLQAIGTEVGHPFPTEQERALLLEVRSLMEGN